MAKAKEVVAASQEPEAIQETSAEAMVTEETPEAAEQKPAKKKDDGYEEILVPKNYLTGPEDEHVPVVLNGKIYQVKLGETVRVPKGVAGILKNAMAQKATVTKLIKNRASAPKALN